MPAILPIPIAVGVWLYVNSGKATDYGAFLRREPDERQQLQRLKAQALTGRVLSVGVAVAYVIALPLGDLAMGGRGRTDGVQLRRRLHRLRRGALEDRPPLTRPVLPAPSIADS